MRIVLNGWAFEAEENRTLNNLTTDLSIGLEGAIVVVNEAVVLEEAWTETVLHHGDRVEILSIVAGG